MATKTKVKKTAKQRFKKFVTALIIIILIIAILCGACTLASLVSASSNNNFIDEAINMVEYDDQIVPNLDDGFYTFKTDREFKVMQLTDIHIGGGFLSTKKDNMALNAVAAMISAEKPDLVVVTGDIAFPVPYSAGTLNNKVGAEIFAQLMEKLGVYWCMGFGNHDTEAYSFYSRSDIAKIYENKEKYPHCLFQSGDENIDGYGNYVINVKNSLGEITQSLFVFDSHSYTDNDYFGILWKYDCIHKSQIDWYEATLAKLTEMNSNIQPKSLAFFHIPPLEMQQAYYEYRDNGYQDTDNVKFLYGSAGEGSAIVYSSSKNEGLIDSFINNGSTKAVFVGHDHLNSFALDYKGLVLAYGYSVDYLAYSGISKYGTQRGCNIITIDPETKTYSTNLENYYQDKYQSVNPKESVIMDYYNDDLPQGQK